MKRLIDLIKLAKSGDEAAMIEILDRFDNLIRKYVRLLNYDEDCRSELVLKLIVLVKNEINIDKMRKDDDSAIVKYISYAIRNHYISISKAYCQIRDNETAYDQETFVDLLEDNLQYSEDYEHGMFMDMLRSILSAGAYRYDCSSVDTFSSLYFICFILSLCCIIRQRAMPAQHSICSVKTAKTPAGSAVISADLRCFIRLIAALFFKLRLQFPCNYRETRLLILFHIDPFTPITCLT